MGTVLIVGVCLVGFVALAAWVDRHSRETAVSRDRALFRTMSALRAGAAGGVTSDGFSVRTAAGVEVMVRRESSSDGPDSFLVRAAMGAIPTDLTMGRETLASRMGKLIAGRDVETGDTEFDHDVLLRGSEPRILALLDQETRQSVRENVSRGAEVGSGAVEISIANPEELEAPARLAASLASRLASRAVQPVPVLLRENAMGDSLPGVRRRCLEALVEFFPSHPETRVALDAASVDPDSTVRLFAASKAIGGNAAKAEALAVLVLDLLLEPQARVDAMRELVAMNAGAVAIGVAEACYDDRVREIRVLAIGVLGRARRAQLVPALVKMAHRAYETDERLALAEAFWRMRDPAAEGVLVEMLSNGATEVRTEAARALGRVGSVRAVEALRAVQKPFGGALGRAAEDAIAAIQARARNASEGQLAVTDTEVEAGRVSVAPAAQGAVSLRDRK